MALFSSGLSDSRLLEANCWNERHLSNEGQESPAKTVEQRPGYDSAKALDSEKISLEGQRKFCSEIKGAKLQSY
jgi:hypothetical protein